MNDDIYNVVRCDMSSPKIMIQCKTDICKRAIMTRASDPCFVNLFKIKLGQSYEAVIFDIRFIIKKRVYKDLDEDDDF